MYNKQGFEEFLIEKELSQNTIDTYLRQMRICFETINEFNKKECLLYKQWLMSSDLAVKTINVKINACNRYSEYCMRKPFTIKGLKEQSKTFNSEIITKIEYDILICSLKKYKLYRQKAMIQFLSLTGARISEALCVKKSHIENGSLKIYNKGKSRTIFIPQRFIQENLELLNTLSEDDFLFSNKRTNKQLTSRGFACILKELSKIIEIEIEKLHAHSFRHFFAIQFMENGGDISLLADLLGHSNLSTTAIYTRLSQAQQKEKIESLVNW